MAGSASRSTIYGSSSPDDHDMELSSPADCDMELPLEAAPRVAGCAFSAQITHILEKLYAQGMHGWGKAHDNEIDMALHTGLNRSQVKVLFPQITK